MDDDFGAIIIIFSGAAVCADCPKHAVAKPAAAQKEKAIKALWLKVMASSKLI
ncbi:MAG: hypothetical protein WDN46_02345 [Methylocella sp.]